MKGRTIIDKPEDPIFSAFIDGYRLATFEIGSYLNPSKLTQHQINILVGIDLRMKCAIDRGMTLTEMNKMLDVFTSRTIKDMLKGKKLCPCLDPTDELYGATAREVGYDMSDCVQCRRFKECWK